MANIIQKYPAMTSASLAMLLVWIGCMVLMTANSVSPFGRLDMELFILIGLFCFITLLVFVFPPIKLIVRIFQSRFWWTLPLIMAIYAFGVYHVIFYIFFGNESLPSLFWIVSETGFMAILFGFFWAVVFIPIYKMLQKR